MLAGSAGPAVVVVFPFFVFLVFVFLVVVFLVVLLVVAVLSVAVLAVVAFLAVVLASLFGWLPPGRPRGPRPGAPVCPWLFLRRPFGCRFPVLVVVFLVDLCVYSSLVSRRPPGVRCGTPAPQCWGLLPGSASALGWLSLGQGPGLGWSCCWGLPPH